jgi:hypothetical protein
VLAKCLGKGMWLQILAIGIITYIYVYLRDSYLEGLSLYIVRIFVLDVLVRLLSEYWQDVEHLEVCTQVWLRNLSKNGRI